MKCKIIYRWYIFIFGIDDIDTSANELGNDLYQINKWAF